MAIQRTTTVDFVLGMLSLRPMSGYEVRQTMESATSNFWSESFGQIYPALKRLVAEGLAEVEETPPGAQRIRKIYRLTDEGRKRLKVWLTAPSERQVPRIELLLKLFFGAQAPEGAMQAQVEARRELLQRDLARYEELERVLPVRRAGNPGLPYFLIAVRFGLVETKAMLGWCDETLAELNKLEPRTETKGKTALGGEDER